MIERFLKQSAAKFGKILPYDLLIKIINIANPETLLIQTPNILRRIDK
jgi:hypothetical protein